MTSKNITNDVKKTTSKSDDGPKSDDIWSKYGRHIVQKVTTSKKRRQKVTTVQKVTIYGPKSDDIWSKYGRQIASPKSDDVKK